jgi:hypothetical protein
MASGRASRAAAGTDARSEVGVGEGIAPWPLADER